MALFDTLKKKYTELLNGVQNSLNDNQGFFQQGQFTPLKGLTNNWSSSNPVTQGLVKAQTIGENFVRNPIPQFQIGKNEGLLSAAPKFVANIPLGIASNVVSKGILSPLTDITQMGIS